MGSTRRATGRSTQATVPDDERALRIVAERFRALGDPRRLKIIRLLCKGERCVQELVTALGAGQTSISKHLAVLTRAGMIGSRREGKFHYYRLEAPEMEGVCAVVCRGIQARLEVEAEALDLLH